MIDRILEITLTLVLVYLVLSRAEGFSTALGSVGSVYTSSVRTLQGR